MRPRDLADLVLLGALWGGSFLFMRVAVPHFGALPVAALRVAGAALLLLPWLALQGHGAALRQHWRPIALVGLTNSALPFLGFSLAARDLPAGLSSILNAASPMFGALIAMLWLREPTPASRLAGLGLGFAGVVLLGRDAGSGGTAMAIGLCLVASLLYGFSACFTRRFLTAAPPLAVAAGSQLSATLVLAAPAAWAWPAASPPWTIWFAVLALALLCTGIAYVLFFRLIAAIRPARAITVTFLVPAFAMVWAAWFLDEPVTPAMLAVCALILLGTGLATGVLRLPRQAAHK